MKWLQITSERDVLVGVSFGVLVEMLGHFSTQHTITSYKKEICSDKRFEKRTRNWTKNESEPTTIAMAPKKNLSQLSSTRAAGRASSFAKCQRKKRASSTNPLDSTQINRCWNQSENSKERLNGAWPCQLAAAEHTAVRPKWRRISSSGRPSLSLRQTTNGQQHLQYLRRKKVATLFQSHRSSSRPPRAHRHCGNSSAWITSFRRYIFPPVT